MSDGARKFDVLVAGDTFVAKIHAREVGFYDVDLYSVEMVTRQAIVNGRLKTSRIITRVLAPVPLPQPIPVCRSNRALGKPRQLRKRT